MKNQGKRLATVEKLAKWIECKIDCDYDRDFQGHMLINQMEYKRKIQFKKELLDRAEQLLDQKLQKI